MLLEEGHEGRHQHNASHGAWRLGEAVAAVSIELSANVEEAGANIGVLPLQTKKLPLPKTGKDRDGEQCPVRRCCRSKQSLDLGGLQDAHLPLLDLRPLASFKATHRVFGYEAPSYRVTEDSSEWDKDVPDCPPGKAARLKLGDQRRYRILVNLVETERAEPRNEVSSKCGRIELVSSGSQVRLHSQPLLTEFLESGARR
jgi:hypothetical protein